MDLVLTADAAAFRAEVRAFLAESLTPKLRNAHALVANMLDDSETSKDWHRRLHARGWAAPAWPKEHGGPGWSPAQKYIFETECARVGAPMRNSSGIRMLGPVLMKFGTDEQKAFYLPRILSGEHYWCQGYSEPRAGSDLASLATKAVRDGDDYIVTGSKIWTTHADTATHMFALVRTSSEGPRQQGITFLLIDMRSPGITVRPILDNGGDHEFNEVFFDSVRVPIANRLGEENAGWDCAKYLLEFERGGGFGGGQARAQFADLMRLARQRIADDSALAAHMGSISADLDALETLELSVMTALEAGQRPGPAASLLKLRWAQIRQAISEAAVDALGPDILAWRRKDAADWGEGDLSEEALTSVAAARYLNFRALTIMGGTAEIQTGIMASAVLHLPSNRAPESRKTA